MDEIFRTPTGGQVHGTRDVEGYIELLHCTSPYVLIVFRFEFLPLLVSIPSPQTFLRLLYHMYVLPMTLSLQHLTWLLFDDFLT